MRFLNYKYRPVYEAWGHLTHTVNSSSPQMMISYLFLHSKLHRNFWCDINIEIEKITLYQKIWKNKIEETIG